jgi:hypothetical protein
MLSKPLLWQALNLAVTLSLKYRGQLLWKRTGKSIRKACVWSLIQAASGFPLSTLFVRFISILNTCPTAGEKGIGSQVLEIYQRSP